MQKKVQFKIENGLRTAPKSSGLTSKNPQNRKGKRLTYTFTKDTQSKLNEHLLPKNVVIRLL